MEKFVGKEQKEEFCVWSRLAKFRKYLVEEINFKISCAKPEFGFSLFRGKCFFKMLIWF